MAEISSRTIALKADDKLIEVKNQKKGNLALNKELRTADGWHEFVKDPKSIAAKHGLQLDSEISEKLSTALSGIDSPEAAFELVGRPEVDGGSTQATLWAVAVGIYSIASTKIAVAF